MKSSPRELAEGRERKLASMRMQRCLTSLPCNTFSRSRTALCRSSFTVATVAQLCVKAQVGFRGISASTISDQSYCPPAKLAFLAAWFLPTEGTEKSKKLPCGKGALDGRCSVYAEQSTIPVDMAGMAGAYLSTENKLVPIRCVSR